MNKLINEVLLNECRRFRKGRQILCQLPGHSISQGDPEELVHGWESATRAFHLQSEQLLAKSQVLENEILAAAERTHDPANEVPEEADHGPKSYRNPWQSSGRKSFISCVREVLMTHTIIDPVEMICRGEDQWSVRGLQEVGVVLKSGWTNLGC